MTIPDHTVAGWRERGSIGLEIPSCSRCKAATGMTWEELGAADSEDVVEVADRALVCGSCGLSSEASDVCGLRPPPSL